MSRCSLFFERGEEKKHAAVCCGKFGQNCQKMSEISGHRGDLQGEKQDKMGCKCAKNGRFCASCMFRRFKMGEVLQNKQEKDMRNILKNEKIYGIIRNNYTYSRRTGEKW